MSEVTVTQFADTLKIPVEKLLAQLGEAGISIDGADAGISDDAKQEQLTYLRHNVPNQGVTCFHLSRNFRGVVQGVWYRETPAFGSVMPFSSRYSWMSMMRQPGKNLSNW